MKKIELTKNGFQVNYDGEISQYEWAEIKKLTGFKIDRITTDDICLKIEFDNKVSYVSEEFEGWRNFIDELLNKFPQIDKNWEGNIAIPAFERNETELYDRKKTLGNTSDKLWLVHAHSEPRNVGAIGFSSGLGFVYYISCSIHATAHSLNVTQHLKNIIFISIFLLSTICTAQINDSLPESKKEYLELLNYTPKNFKIDLKNKPINEFLKTDLNSIWKLKTAYELKYNLNESEINWLEKQINQLALTYFLENKPIIIQDVSGFSGCPEQLLTTELKNETEITIVSFCFGGCIRNINTENFIRIFNNRTEKLLQN